jgi:hypothetical protein
MNIDIEYLRNCYFDLARNVICIENFGKSKNVRDGNEMNKENKKKYKLVPQ